MALESQPLNARHLLIGQSPKHATLEQVERISVCSLLKDERAGQDADILEHADEPGDIDAVKSAKESHTTNEVFEQIE